MKGLDLLVQALSDESNAVCLALVNEALEDGKALKEKLIHEHDERLARRQERYQREAKELEEREIKRHQMQVQLEENQLRQNLIDEVIDESLRELQSIDSKALIQLIERVMETAHEAEVSGIEVNPEHAEALRSHFKAKAEILEDPAIQHGFRIRGERFDMNYEFEKLFQHYRPVLRTLVMEVLFGEKHA